MTHDHNFQLDLDGQVTCVICGGRDDEAEHYHTYKIKCKKCQKVFISSTDVSFTCLMCSQ